MECQVPPEELERFQKLWDEDAPRRCQRIRGRGQGKLASAACDRGASR
jgi:hypothetical protein